MNGGQWRKRGKCFCPPFPQNLTKSENIWPWLTSRHLLLGEKTGEHTHPPSSNNKGGTDIFIEWESMEAKNGNSVLAAIPPKPDQILKYLARINFKAFTTENKRHKDLTHPFSHYPLFQQLGWTDRYHSMGVNAGRFGNLTYMTSRNCFHFF